MTTRRLQIWSRTSTVSTYAYLMLDRSEALEFLESADVARMTGLTPASVNLAADAGRIRVSARTLRGGRLFTREDVERFAAERAARGRLREEKR
jgi:hypothetical protein